MAIQLTIDQQCTVTLSITDRAGNPATVDDAPVWSIDGIDGATVTPAEDGLSAVLTAGDVVDEVGLLKVEVDADLGDGVRPIIGTIDVQIVGGEAQFVEIAAGAPEPKADVVV